MKTALITGASGFCGGHLAERLREEGGVRVVGIGRSATFTAQSLFDDYASVDISCKNELADAVRRWMPDRVFHLGSLRQGDPDDLQRVNVQGTVHLLETLDECCPQAKVLLVGSAAEYGGGLGSESITESQPCQPAGPYGQSKYQATCIGMSYARRGMHVTVARPFNIVGAGIGPGLFVGDLLRRIDQSMRTDSQVVLRVGNLEAKRDFIAVEDTVDAYARLLEAPTSGEIFNICSGVAHSMQHLLALLLKNVPAPVTVRVDPELYKANDVPISFGSFAKAAHTIGFQPTRDLAISVAKAWKYYWRNGKHE